MKKLPRGIRWVMVALVLGFAAFLWLRDDAPEYQGRSVRVWIRRLDFNNAAASDCLVTLGPAAMPYLVEEMRRTRESGSRRLREQLYERIAVLSFRFPRLQGIYRYLPPLGVSLEIRQALVARVLGRLGSVAVPALPELMHAARPSAPPLVRYHALTALGQLGTHAGLAMPVVCEALKDGDYAVRRQAALAMAQIGPTAADRAMVEALRRLEADRVQDVQLAAAIALWRFEPTNQVAAETIRTTLLSAPADVLRTWAASMLGDLGPVASPWLPELEQAKTDGRETVRRAASNAVAKLGALAGGGTNR